MFHERKLNKTVCTFVLNFSIVHTLHKPLHRAYNKHSLKRMEGASKKTYSNDGFLHWFRFTSYLRCVVCVTILKSASYNFVSMHPNSEMEVTVVLTLLLQVIVLCLLITLNKKVTALKQKVSNLSTKSKSLKLKPAIPTRFKDGKTTTNPDSVSPILSFESKRQGNCLENESYCNCGTMPPPPSPNSTYCLIPNVIPRFSQTWLKCLTESLDIYQYQTFYPFILYFAQRHHLECIEYIDGTLLIDMSNLLATCMRHAGRLHRDFWRLPGCQRS